MSTNTPQEGSIHYGPFDASYSILKDPTPLSRFYAVTLTVHYRGEVVLSDDLTLTVCLHLTKGYYSAELDEYLKMVHNRIKSYIWSTLLEESFVMKGLLDGQAHVLLRRVGNNLLESLYSTKPS